MLYCFLLQFTYFRFFQSGFNLDYLLKKITEIFIKNFFIFSALFFGEKFLIEYITKKSIDNYIFNFNKFFNFFELFYSKFFLLILFFIFFVWSSFLFLF